MIKDKIPYIKANELQTEFITELTDEVLKSVKSCCNKYIGKPNTETTIACIQSEIDDMCGGRRLFQVNKKYDIVRRRVPICDEDGEFTGEYACIREQVLNPYVLEIVWVGDGV